MTFNIGKIDLIIRIIFSVVISALYFLNILEGSFENIALPIAILLFFTAVKGCCPLYSVFGFGTCTVKTKRTNIKILVKKLKK